MNLKEIEKLANARNNAKVKCKCGHTLNMGFQDKVICHWCGKYVFKNKKIEFEYRMKEINKKVKKC